MNKLFLPILVLGALSLSASAQTISIVNDFGAGGISNGWQSDDTRNASGIHIKNGTTNAPLGSATLDAAGVAAQIDWLNNYGSRGNLGGVRLDGTSGAGGKSTLSLVDATTGFGAASLLNDSAFSATYRWQNNDTVVPGVAFKIGIQSTNWGTGGGQSQSGYTPTRSGEPAWDLLLVYDPAEPGNQPGNTTTNGTFHTSSINYTTGKFYLFDQSGNPFYTTPGFTGKTLAEWAADPTWGSLLFGAGAKITSTQFGLGSGNENAAGTVDFATISYLNSGKAIDFADGTKWTSAVGGDIGNSSNWAGGSVPGAAVNGLFDLNSTYTVSVPADTSVRTLGVSNGNVTFDVVSGQTLTLANDGYLFADSGATLSTTGAGSITAAVVDAVGTINLATVTDLDGGSVPHPVRDGTNPLATSRYGMVVEAGGTVNLLSGADVTVSQMNKNVGVRVGEGVGTGTLTIAAGANLEVGNTDSFAMNGLQSNGFIVVGDFGSTGVVTQTGGTALLTDGSLNLGNQGGTGTWSISGGSLTLAGGLHSLGRNTGNRVAGTGTMNISGTALVEIKASLNNGPAAFVAGDRDDSDTDGFGVINQTGGTLRVANGSVLHLGGYGSSQYNLSGGTLEVGGASLQGLYANNGTGSYAFNLGGGTIKVIGSDLSTSVNAATVAATVSIINTNGFNANWSGNLSGSGILAKAGTGTLTLTGTNAITGEFYVVGGEVAQTAGTSGIKYYAVGSGSGNTGTASLSSGTLNISQALQVGDFSGTGTFNQTGGTINVAAPTMAGASLNIGNQGGNGTYNLSGGQLNLGGVNEGLYSLGRANGANPGGVGVLNLSGSGLLEVQSGSFIIGDRDSPGAAGRGLVTQTGGTFRVNSGAYLFLGGFTPTIGGTNTYDLNGGTLEIGGNSLVANYSGVAPYAFNLGGGTIKVIGSSLVTVADTTLVAATTSKIDTNGFNATLSGTLSGAGSLEKQSAGELDLTASNSYTGTTTITAGSVEVTANNALGTAAAGTTVANGATLKLTNVNYTTAEALTINGNGVGGGGALVNSGTSTYAGQITAATSAKISTGGGTLNLTGGVVKDGTTLTVTGGGRVNVNGTGISGASANSDLVVDGTTLVVNATSNYNGPTTVQNSGTLVANAAVTTTQLTVSSTSTLSGTGSINAGANNFIYLNGVMMVGDSTLVSPVASNFTLATSGTGSTVLGAGSLLNFDLFSGAGLGNSTGNAAAADYLTLFGTLDVTLGSTLVLNNPNSMTGFALGDSWKLIDWATAPSVVGLLNIDYSSLNLPGYLGGSFDQNSGVFSVVPEPSRALLLVLGGMGLILRRRRAMGTAALEG